MPFPLGYICCWVGAAPGWIGRAVKVEQQIVPIQDDSSVVDKAEVTSAHQTVAVVVPGLDNLIPAPRHKPQVLVAEDAGLIVLSEHDGNGGNVADSLKTNPLGTTMCNYSFSLETLLLW